MRGPSPRTVANKQIGGRLKGWRAAGIRDICSRADGEQGEKTASLAVTERT